MNDLSDWLSPIERAYHEFAQFFVRVPLDEKVERVDRRVFRWVLCGDCGFRRHWRERCPVCGGYAQARVNSGMRRRLKRLKAQTAKKMKAGRLNTTTAKP